MNDTPTPITETDANETSQRLKRELASAIKSADNAKAYKRKLKDDNKILRYQRDALADALAKAEPYMRHDLYCHARVTKAELGCTCGMIDARVAVIETIASVK